MFTERKAALLSSVTAIVFTVLVGIWLLASELGAVRRQIATIGEESQLAVDAVREAREEALTALRRQTWTETGRYETARADWAQLDADEDGIVTLEQEIRFARPFSEAPVLSTGLSRLDVATGLEAGVGVSAAEVTAEGFTLRVTVRASREIRAIDAFWVAHLPSGPPQAAEQASRE